MHTRPNASGGVSLTLPPDDAEEQSQPRDPRPASRESRSEAGYVVSPGPARTAEGSPATGVVRARGVQFAYSPGAPVLNGIDVEIRVGEIVAFVGPKGAGKSTLLRILAGDLTPTEGELALPARRSADGRIMLGYAGSEDAHFEALSGWENAVFFARAGGMRRREAEAAVAELMEILGLKEQASAPVAQYNPESRRRLMLLEALAHRPALTVLDDPFEGLSQRRREALIHALRVRSAQRGTVVVASEDLTLMPELADRILFIHQGRIVAAGRVAELLATVGAATRLEVYLERRPQHLDPRFRAGIEIVSEGNPYVLEAGRGSAAVGEVTAALTAAGATVKSVTIREPDLAEAFRRATGVELQG